MWPRGKTHGMLNWGRFIDSRWLHLDDVMKNKVTSNAEQNWIEIGYKSTYLGYYYQTIDTLVTASVVAVCYRHYFAEAI